MQTTGEINQAMQAKLSTAGIPAESIKVFGAIRCNVHVTCVGRETAQKWAELLAQVFKAKVALVPHEWNAVENKGTSMRPTKRSGFLVAVAA